MAWAIAVKVVGALPASYFTEPALLMAQGDVNGGLSGPFTNLFVVTNTTAGTNTYLDIGTLTNASARYYRVRLLP